MNVFLDTNVVIDLLGKRKPYYDDVTTIVEMYKQDLYILQFHHRQ